MLSKPVAAVEEPASFSNRTISARLRHVSGAIPEWFRRDFGTRSNCGISPTSLAQLGTEVPTDFQLNNNFSRAVSHGTYRCKFESLREHCWDLAMYARV